MDGGGWPQGETPMQGRATSVQREPGWPPVAPDWKPAQPGQAKRWVIPLIGGLGLLLFLPPIFSGVANGWEGPAFLGIGTPLALLFVVLGLIGSYRPQTTRSGGPATFGETPYGLRRQEGKGVMALIRDLPPRKRALHQIGIFGPIIIVGIAGLGVMAAVIFGPRGVAGVEAGLGVLLGTVFLFGAYVLGSYRALVPTAVGAAVWGLLIEVQSVWQAWDGDAQMNAWWLILLVPFIAVQTLASEAAFRGRVFWGFWAAIGIVGAVAYPVWLFLDIEAGRQVALGITLGSLVWGVGAVYAVLPIHAALRWVGIAIFAVWSAFLALAYSMDASLLWRLQASGLVAAAVMAGITTALYYLMRPCPPHASVPPG